jgi:hypothetical protein
MDIINNLVSFSNKNNIKLFKKNNILKKPNKLIELCNKIKRKKILELSLKLKLLSSKIIELDKIKLLQEEINNEIKEIDEVIILLNNNIIYDDKFIEIYNN